MPTPFPPPAVSGFVQSKRSLDGPSGHGPKRHKGTTPHKAFPAPLIIAAPPPASPPPTEEPRRSRRLASMRKGWGMGKKVSPGGCFGNCKLLVSKIVFWSCPLEKPGVEEGSRLSAV
jgi:hypothetical protein